MLNSKKQTKMVLDHVVPHAWCLSTLAAKNGTRRNVSIWKHPGTYRWLSMRKTPQHLELHCFLTCCWHVSKEVTKLPRFIISELVRFFQSMWMYSMESDVSDWKLRQPNHVPCSQILSMSVYTTTKFLTSFKRASYLPFSNHSNLFLPLLPFSFATFSMHWLMAARLRSDWATFCLVQAKGADVK